MPRASNVGVHHMCMFFALIVLLHATAPVLLHPPDLACMLQVTGHNCLIAMAAADTVVTDANKSCLRHMICCAACALCCSACQLAQALPIPIASARLPSSHRRKISVTKVGSVTTCRLKLPAFSLLREHVMKHQQ